MRRSMLAVAILTIPLYELCYAAARSLGWSPMPVAMVGPGGGIPNTYQEGWVVLPGALALGWVLCRLLRHRPRKVLWGALWGGALGPCNVVLSTFLALTWWHLRGLWAGTTTYFYTGLLECWLGLAPFMVWRCLPLALPCGVLVGALMGAAWEGEEPTNGNTFLKPG